MDCLPLYIALYPPFFKGAKTPPIDDDIAKTGYILSWKKEGIFPPCENLGEEGCSLAVSNIDLAPMQPMKYKSTMAEFLTGKTLQAISRSSPGST